MTQLAGTLAVSAVLVLAPGLAAAQDSEWQNEPAPQAPQAPQPQELPPPPPAEQPAAPVEQGQPYAQQYAPPSASTAAVPPGQWVYTQQYGWIWMPYSDAYTQVPADGYGAPYAYVYAPAWSCWTWLAAPWVWGVGPWPWFGYYGPARFAWYGHGWWRYPARWHYAAPYRGYASPAYRGGWPRPAAAPFRGNTGAYRAPYRGSYGGYRGSVAAPHAGGSGFVARGGGAGYPRPGGSIAGGGGFGRGGAVSHGGGFAPRGGSSGRGGGHGHGRGR